MKYQDYYETMGVARDATQDEIKKAYRKLARKYHPDVSQDEDAEAKFKALGEAYAVLKDPDQRTQYDQLGSSYRAGEDFDPPPEWQSNAGGSHEFDAENLSDLFSSLFGDRGRAHHRPAKTPDAHVRLFVTLEDLYAGRPVLIAFIDPGTGTERQLRVSVPKDVRDGQSFRLKGQVSSGNAAMPPGDIYVELRTIPHPDFNVDGNDIHSELIVSPWEAVLGGPIPVNTLGGQISLNVPSGSCSGTRLRVKGRGLPGSNPGHQYVTLKVQVPKAVSEKEREYFEALAQESSFDPTKPA